MRYLRLIFITGLIAFLTGCGSLNGLFPDQVDQTKNWSASKFYSEAKKALGEGDYELAVQYYETLEARYPFGRFAQQAQIETAYAYYKAAEPESSLAASDRFIKLHPRHPNIDYVYYLKGLANFDAGKDIVSTYLPQDPTQRDPGAARQSFQDFGELLRRFPESKYAKDARQRMIFLRNNLAAYEIHVARYYMKRKAYIAAANRAKYVVENFQRTTAVPNALNVMVVAYSQLGLKKLSGDAMRILAANYPEHPAYQKAQNNIIN